MNSFTLVNHRLSKIQLHYMYYHINFFVRLGAGGRDLSGNKRTSEQCFDQTLTKTNQAKAISCKAMLDEEKGADAGDAWHLGKPIRVIRTEKLKKHSKFAPDEGCRYDGIYKVSRSFTFMSQTHHDYYH